MCCCYPAQNTQDADIAILKSLLDAAYWGSVELDLLMSANDPKRILGSNQTWRAIVKNSGLAARDLLPFISRARHQNVPVVPSDAGPWQEAVDWTGRNCAILILQSFFVPQPHDRFVGVVWPLHHSLIWHHSPPAGQADTIVAIVRIPIAVHDFDAIGYVAARLAPTVAQTFKPRFERRRRIAAIVSR